MVTIHDPGLFYDAIITRVGTQTGKNIGRVEAPSDRTTPYAVLTPVDDTAPFTSLGDPSESTVYQFQVASWGDTPAQAEWMATQVRSALLGWTPTVSGWAFNPTQKSGGLPTRRDDSVQPPKYQMIDEFSVFTG